MSGGGGASPDWPRPASGARSADDDKSERIVGWAESSAAHRGRIAAIYHEVDERWIDAVATAARLRAAGFKRVTRFGIGRHYDILAEMPKI